MEGPLNDMGEPPDLWESLTQFSKPRSLVTVLYPGVTYDPRRL